MDIQKMELLAQVASLYYLENLTQEHIARQFGYSRSMVSRLLRVARQSGVVEIRVHRQIIRNHSLEQQLGQVAKPPRRNKAKKTVSARKLASQVSK